MPYTPKILEKLESWWERIISHIALNGCQVEMNPESMKLCKLKNGGACWILTPYHNIIRVSWHNFL